MKKGNRGARGRLEDDKARHYKATLLDGTQFRLKGIFHRRSKSPKKPWGLLPSPIVLQDQDFSKRPSPHSSQEDSLKKNECSALTKWKERGGKNAGK